MVLTEEQKNLCIVRESCLASAARFLHGLAIAGKLGYGNTNSGGARQELAPDEWADVLVRTAARAEEFVYQGAGALDHQFRTPEELAREIARTQARIAQLNVAKVPE